MNVLWNERHRRRNLVEMIIREETKELKKKMEDSWRNKPKLVQYYLHMYFPIFRRITATSCWMKVRNQRTSGGLQWEDDDPTRNRPTIWSMPGCSGALMKRDSSRCQRNAQISVRYVGNVVCMLYLQYFANRKGGPALCTYFEHVVPRMLCIVISVP